MNNDIVQYLRSGVYADSHQEWLNDEAAKEIERLRDKLKSIASMLPTREYDKILALFESEDDMSWEKYNEWLQYGIDKGYCSSPACYTHDLIPMADKEVEPFFEEKLCIQMSRLYGNEIVFESIVETSEP